MCCGTIKAVYSHVHAKVHRKGVRGASWAIKFWGLAYYYGNFNDKRGSKKIKDY